jgi:hypothetical protein
MAEPSAKRLDQKTEPDIADIERRGGSDDNANTSGPHLDLEAVRVELVSFTIVLGGKDAAELSSR